MIYYNFASDSNMSAFNMPDYYFCSVEPKINTFPSSPFLPTRQISRVPLV